MWVDRFTKKGTGRELILMLTLTLTKLIQAYPVQSFPNITHAHPTTLRTKVVYIVFFEKKKIIVVIN